MESVFTRFFTKSKKENILPKKVELTPVSNKASFEDQTLTKDFLNYLNERIELNANLLVRGGWEDEAGARDLVGYLRACSEFKAEFERIVKILYTR